MVQESIIKLIKKSTLLFFDFDGVIKDSVDAKTRAFERLFNRYGDNVVKRIVQHHEENSGVSRYEKLPLYLKWSGILSNDENLERFSKDFSVLAMQSVLESAWVPGVYSFLKKLYSGKELFVITATPQEEIELILKKLNISDYFSGIVGSPTPKKRAIRAILDKYSINPSDTVMFGDSLSDLEAAKFNKVEFVLRRTRINHFILREARCHVIDNYEGLSENIT